MSELLLLGQATFLEGGELHDLPPEAPTWLLVMLACHGSWLDRGELAAMFWPDEPETRARHNLSQLLYRSRRQPWAHLIEAEPRRIRFTGDSDVAALQRSLASHDWQAAANLWQGPLLGSMSGPDVHTWDEWLAAERQNLLAGFKEAARMYASDLARNGRPDEAADVLQAALRFDPLDETILQAYLTAALAGGRRPEAASVYREFKKQLNDELELEPLPETVQFATRLQEPGSTVGTASRGLRGAPAGMTELVARELELAQITGELQHPDVRLLTVTGPGGVGKTSIALAAGNMLAGQYDLAQFVQLAPLDSPALFLPAVAEALGLELSGQLTPEAQLITSLSDRKVLLVLDNFEHLLPAAAQLAALMQGASSLDVLVTSREPLGVRGETVFELGGLAVPDSAAGSQFADYGAVQLLNKTVRRSLPDVDALALPRPAVLKLLTLLGGLPLGIELAVPWLKLLPVSELTAELERNLALLQAGHGSDLPERHRSLEAAFTHSWQLLEPDEQNVLARLAVFRGPFSRTAADRVGNATLLVLLSLLSKSLLRRSPGGRFELDPPARQFAAARQQDETGLRNSHAAWLAELAATAEVELHGSGQREWLERLAAQHADFVAAIEWATLSDQATLGLSIATALQPLWWLRGPYQAGAAMLLRLTELNSARNSPLLARGLHRAGTLLQEIGDTDRLAPLYTRALQLARAAGDSVLIADITHSLAFQLDRNGDLSQAAAAFEEAVELYRHADFRPGESASLNSLAIIHARSGRFQKAKELLEESLRQKRELGQTQGVAYALSNLALVHLEMGDKETYRALSSESTELKRQIGDVPGVISGVLNEAAELLDEGDHLEAACILAPVLEDAWRIGSSHLLLQILQLSAGAIGAGGDAVKAAQLLGGVEAQRERHGFRSSFTDLHELTRRRIQDDLGANGLHRQLAAGAGFTLEQLVGLARPATHHLQLRREQLPYGA